MMKHTQWAQHQQSVKISFRIWVRSLIIPLILLIFLLCEVTSVTIRKLLERFVYGSIRPITAFLNENVSHDQFVHVVLQFNFDWF